MTVSNPNLVHFSIGFGEVARNQSRFVHPLITDGISFSSLQQRMPSHIDNLILESYFVHLVKGDVGITSTSTVAVRLNGAILQTQSGLVLNRKIFSQAELNSAQSTPIKKIGLLQMPDPPLGEGAVKKLTLERSDELSVSLQLGSALNDQDRARYHVSFWGTWFRTV